MFQVWFMKNNANETLQGYNQRLGRPRIQIRNGIVGKTKYILGSKSWWNYFDELGVIIKDDNAIDQLLRFAIYNSKKSMYHKSYGSRLVVQRVNAPMMRTNDPKSEGSRKFVEEGPSVGIKMGSGRGWGQQNNIRGSAWRGRGRGGQTRYQNAGRGRGRGRGFTPRGPSQNQYQSPPQNQRGRGFTPRGPPQSQNQNPNPIRPGPRSPQQPQYSHITPGMQNALNNNNNNNNYQPGAQPGSVNNNNNNNNGNWNTEMPQRESKSSRNRRRRRKNKNKNGNNGNQ